MDFLLQPSIYRTTNSDTTLLSLLEKAWIKDLRTHTQIGNGVYYILSGFTNFNGGVRFYNHLENHILQGGQCKVILGGSTTQRMTSKQVVQKLLEIGCEVGIVNRKAIFHAKCYGFQNETLKNLIITSGNFTSRGLSQNIEASLYLQSSDLKMPFDWEDLFKSIKKEKLDYQQATLDFEQPVWRLLFDEDRYRTDDGDNDILSTMLITLSHSDTSRIQAEPGSNAGKGTQYFWLSKDCFDFFPPLNEKNSRGVKNAYQTVIKVKYIDLPELEIKEERVTFEAENNYDFRLGTSAFRYTKKAKEGDLAAISRLSDKEYEIRIIGQDDPRFDNLIKYATTYIGHRGKRYGYIPNKTFNKIAK